MTPREALRARCEALSKTFNGIYVRSEWVSVEEETIQRLMAFAAAERANEAEACAELLKHDPDNILDWTDALRQVADTFAKECEARAAEWRDG